MVKEERRKMDIRMAKIETDIGYIKESLDDNKVQHKEMMQTLEKAIERIESTKAGKWVEKVLIYIAITIASVTIPIVIYQIFHI
jgi:hypothetical protein